MNSTKEAGGTAPFPLHEIWLEVQSAVSQVNLLGDESVEQSVRAQNRPDQGGVMLRGLDDLEGSSNPVMDSGDPLPVSVPGQIVCGQLFVIVIVVAGVPVV